MNNEQLESIWADGVPAKIDEKDVLTYQEILRICIKFVLDKIIVPKNYKVLGINDDPQKFPNITVEKDGMKYGLVVVPNKFPLFAAIKADFRITYVKGCEEHNIIPVFCPVLIYSVDKDRAAKSIFLRGDLFNARNVGQQILNKEEKQEITPQTLNFKL